MGFKWVQKETDSTGFYFKRFDVIESTQDYLRNLVLSEYLEDSKKKIGSFG